MKREIQENLLCNLRCVSLEPNYWNLEKYDLDIEQIVKIVADANANAIRVGFFGHSGYAYYPSEIAPHVPGLKGRDFLAEFQQHCSDNGIELIVYANCSWDYHKYDVHPEWVVKIHGEKSMETEVPFVRMCLNSPYRDYSLSVHREMMERYKPNIFYIDTFKLNHFCDCKYCCRELEKSTGLKVPQKADWKDEHWCTYVDWRLKRELELAKIFTDNVKAVKPETVVIINRERFQNQISSTPEANYELAHTIADHIHGESAVRLQQDEFWHINQQCYYGQSMDVALWLWVEYVNGWWVHSACPPDEIKLKIVKTIANGGRPNIWSLPFAPSGDLSSVSAIKQAYGLIKDNPVVFDGTKTCADTAILTSTASRQFYVQGIEPFKYPYKPEDKDLLFQEEFDGLSKLCQYSHQLQTYILDRDLEYEKLKNYKTLILPNVGSISDNGVNAIKEFVKQGGSLIASYETSLYDEKGNKRSDFGLADVFGARYNNETESISKFGQRFKVPGYVSLTEQNIINSIETVMPAAGRVLAVSPKSADVLAHMMYPGSYHITYNELVSNVPGVICNEYGKGRVVYFSYEFGYSYFNGEPLQILKCFKDLVNWLRRGELTIETNLSALAEISLRKTENGDFILHIIPVAANRPQPDQAFSKIEDVSIKLDLSVFGTVPKDIQRVTGGYGRLDYEIDTNTIELNYDKINDYEVVRIAMC